MKEKTQIKKKEITGQLCKDWSASKVFHRIQWRKRFTVITIQNLHLSIGSDLITALRHLY